MEVDVDAFALAGREPEHGIEMTLDVEVDPGRIEAADEIRAGVDRGGQKVRGARIAQDPALREGDDLDVDEVAIGLLQPKHRFEPGQADVRVDVDMRAQRAGAESRDLLDEAPAALLDRKVEGGAERLLVPDPIQNRRPRPVRDERQAQQGLVEVDMAFHERRHEERPGAVEHRRARPSRLLPGGRDGADRPARDRDVDARPSANLASVSSRVDASSVTGSARPGGPPRPGRAGRRRPFPLRKPRTRG